MYGNASLTSVRLAWQQQPWAVIHSKCVTSSYASDQRNIISLFAHARVPPSRDLREFLSFRPRLASDIVAPPSDETDLAIFSYGRKTGKEGAGRAWEGRDAQSGTKIRTGDRRAHSFCILVAIISIARYISSIIPKRGWISRCRK